MTEKSLKKLSRTDLLRLLVEQTKQSEAMQAEAEAKRSELEKENEDLRRQLATRTYEITEAGSLAEAAVRVSGVLTAAQEAAEQYLSNIMEQSSIDMLQQQEAETQQRCDSLLAETEAECARRRAETDRLCEGAMAEARQKIDAYWEELSSRLVMLYEAYQGMQQFLTAGNMEPVLSAPVKNAVLLSDNREEETV